jgi:ribose transport system ATP-binding protein
VLDEVAASLPLPEVESLFAAIRRLTARGAGVLYISHRLGEIFDIADRVTVLRDGKLVTTTSIGELDHDRLINLIVGRKLESMYVTSPPARPDVVLSLRDLQAGAIEQLSFDVHAGEMLGITGLVGSGMDDVAEAMVGAIRVDRGTVTVDGTRVSPLSIPSAKARGIELVPANRQVKGCIPQQSVRWNLTLGDLQPLRRWYGLSPTLERNETAEWIRRVDVRPPDQDKPLAQLSGGNQQKVVIAKCLRAKPRVLILHEPTQGVDVGARAAIWELLARVLEDDGAVIICSSEIEDLPHVCDRVLVMEEGRVQAELTGDRLTDDNLTAAILSTVRITNPSTGSLAGDAS